MTDVANPLGQVTVTLPSGGTMTLADVVAAWAKRVARFQAEVGASLDDPGTWGGHDYIGTLHWRANVAAAIELAPPEFLDLMRERVASVDAAFLSFTEPDQRDQVSSFAGERPFGDAWWWQRLPRTGPARAEIDEVTTP